MDFKKTLEDANYTLYKICLSCGGTKTHKFRSNINKDIEIHVKEKIQRFLKFSKGRIQLSDKLLNLPNHV